MRKVLKLQRKVFFYKKSKNYKFCNSFGKILTNFNLFRFAKSEQIYIGSLVNIAETYNAPSQKII